MELAVLTNGGNTRRVVAAVFELPQALQQLGSRFPRTNQGNDAAHRGETRSETNKKPGTGPGLSLWELDGNPAELAV
jgi:hypothetical protein